MSNKKIGNDFEAELCEMLSLYGFWCHNLAVKSEGQPADVIAARNVREHKLTVSFDNGRSKLTVRIRAHCRLLYRMKQE